jgi:hypothetical protein
MNPWSVLQTWLHMMSSLQNALSPLTVPNPALSASSHNCKKTWHYKETKTYSFCLPTRWTVLWMVTTHYVHMGPMGGGGGGQYCFFPETFLHCTLNYSAVLKNKLFSISGHFHSTCKPATYDTYYCFSSSKNDVYWCTVLCVRAGCFYWPAQFRYSIANSVEQWEALT